MNGNCSLISKVPMLRHNHPWIALFQLHHFSWKPYYWWRHHPWMTSYIQFWWRHMTWFYFICYNLDPSMILPSFITNGSFSEILRPIPWSRGLDNSRYQGLLLEGPGLSEGGLDQIHPLYIVLRILSHKKYFGWKMVKSKLMRDY